MSTAPSASDLRKDARWLAQALDASAGAVRLIEMDRDAYRAASFLDDRIMQAKVNAFVLPWVDVAAAMERERRFDAAWIFHIGHVGSTLISRLLGELETILSVREPRILRDLAVMPTEVRTAHLEHVRKLLSRTFQPRQTAVVKATSFVSELATELVPASGRALFLYVPAQIYLATILAGENSRKELQVMASSRAARLGARVPQLALTEGNDALLAAAAWACEMTALESAAEAMPDRHIHWANFDRQIGDIETALAELTQFFEAGASAERLGEIARGPLVTRYSKALEYDYSPDLRRDLLAEAEHMYKPQIGQALAMLEACAQDSPLLARALARR